MQKATQLRMIRRGEHPVTKASLGPPTTLHHLNITESSNGQPDGTNSHKSPPCIDNDGTAFSDAFRRRGIRPVDGGEGTDIRHRIRAKETANLLQLCSNGSGILDFLTEAELSDPDLVGFWSEDPDVTPGPREPLASGAAGETSDVTMGRPQDREQLASGKPRPDPPEPREHSASGTAEGNMSTARLEGHDLVPCWATGRQSIGRTFGSHLGSRDLGWNQPLRPATTREIPTRLAMNNCRDRLRPPPQRTCPGVKRPSSNLSNWLADVVQRRFAEAILGNGNYGENPKFA